MASVASLCCHDPLPDSAAITLRILRLLMRVGRTIERRLWLRAYVRAQSQVQELNRIDHRFLADIFFD